MFTIYHRKNRTRAYDIQLFEDDGSTEVTLAADDVVRVKIHRGTDSTDLDLASYEDTSSGSGITFTAGTNNVCLTVAQGDVDDWEPGGYDMEVNVVDNSDHVGTPATNAIKHAETGVFFLHPSAGGSTSDEQSSSSSSSSS